MARLILEGSSTSQWQQLIVDAQALACRQLDETDESYLVFLLMRYLRSAELLRHVMALGYLHAVQSSGRVQSERLRDVGDQCLILAGLFPGQARRRRVREEYFITLGQSAYDQVQRTAPSGLAELYAGLAERFVDLRDVLAALRGIGTEQDCELLGRAIRQMDRLARAEAGQAVTTDGKIPGLESPNRH